MDLLVVEHDGKDLREWFCVFELIVYRRSRKDNLDIGLVF